MRHVRVKGPSAKTRWRDSPGIAQIKLRQMAQHRIFIAYEFSTVLG
jgi:hypothetical protein